MSLEGYPQQTTLRDGSTVTLVPLDPSESKALLEFYRALPEEDRQVLKDDVTTEDWAERFIHRVGSKELVSLVAKCGKELVGEGTLYRTLHGWTRHVGEIRITVGKQHRRKGLGLALATNLLKIATDLGMEKMVVQVVESQVGARRIFEKLGFHKEAILTKHVQDIGGVKRDLIIMANDVSQIWAAMEAMVSDFAPHQGE